MKALKISVIVQATHEESVRAALGKAGAGRIGNYKNCQFVTRGEAQFESEEDANPVLGEKLTLTTVPAVQIQTWCFEGELENLIKVVKEAHPNEEPGIEIIPFEMR